MTRARAVTASVAAGIACAVLTAGLVAYTIAALPWAAWRQRKAGR